MEDDKDRGPGIARRPALSDQITSISIEGFKSIRRIRDLPLRPINVLIGANGSGKSNFVGVFTLLQAVRDDAVDRYIARAGGADRRQACRPSATVSQAPRRLTTLRTLHRRSASRRLFPNTMRLYSEPWLLRRSACPPCVPSVPGFGAGWNASRSWEPRRADAGRHGPYGARPRASTASRRPSRRHADPRRPDGRRVRMPRPSWAQPIGAGSRAASAGARGMRCGQTEARKAPPACRPAFSPASLPLKCLSSSSMEMPPP